MMKILAAAKLIELDEEDNLTQLPDLPLDMTDTSHEIPVEDTGSMSHTMDAPDSSNVDLQTEPATSTTPLTDSFVENKDFQQIYTEANVTQSPYPAERLIRLLDGLQAMDAATRHAAVQAMDAADDTWSIADPISDAEKKSASLNAYAQSLQTQNTAYEQQLMNEIQLLKSEQAETVASIRKQIEDLENLQQRQIEKTQTNIAEKQAAISQQHERVSIEVARLDAEANKLNQVAQQFAHLLSES